MLQSFRDTIMGWVGYVIVGLIILVFTLWGVQSYLGVAASPPVADVDGIEISQFEFQNALLGRQQMLRQRLGDIPAAQFSSPQFRQAVLDDLIRNRLITAAAEKRGYDISDKMLADRIQTEPSFQDNGVFSRAKYDQALEVQRRSKTEFEKTLRKQLQVNQVGTAISNTAFVSAADASRFAELEQQQRAMRMVRIVSAPLAEGVEVSAAEVQSYYDDNQAQFMSEEQVLLDYVQLSESELRAAVDVDESALKGLYEEAPQNFLAPESRQVRHILLKVEEGATQEQENSVKQAAEEIYARLGAGEDFASLATSLSQDDLTAEQGGVLPEVFPGDLQSALERAVFSASENGFTAPVRTGVGYQIAKIDKVLGGGQLSFEQAKDALEQEYRQREVDERFQSISVDMVSMSFENNSIAEIADSTNLPLKKSSWITRTARTGIAADQAVAAAAFSDKVLNLGETSDVIDMRDGSQILLRLAERKAPALMSLESVKTQIEGILKNQKARDLAQQQGVDLVAKLNSGSSLEDLATADGLEITTNEQVSRRSRDLDAAVLTQLFRMPAPTPGSTAYSAVSLNNGDQVVLALDSVTAVTDVAIDEGVAARLAGGYRSREIAAFFEAMRGNARISIVEENMVPATQ